MTDRDSIIEFILSLQDADIVSVVDDDNLPELVDEFIRQNKYDYDAFDEFFV